MQYLFSRLTKTAKTNMLYKNRNEQKNQFSTCIFKFFYLNY